MISLCLPHSIGCSYGEKMTFVVLLDVQKAVFQRILPEDGFG